MKKTLQRFASLLLLASLLTSLTACGGSETVSDDTTTAAPVDTTTAAPEGYQYPDVDYGGYKFRILNFGDYGNSYVHLDFEEETGDKLDDAVYQRNIKVEEKLNFELVEITRSYSKWEVDQIALMDAITNSVMAGDDEYDAAYIQPYFKPSILTDGSLLDLKGIPELKLDEEYWDGTLNESNTIMGKLYTASGPLHLMAIEMCWCLLFNEDMVADHQLASPYQLVRDGKWTLDKFNEYASIPASLNGDESFTYNKEGKATYGIAGHLSSIPVFVYAADHRFVESADDGFVINLGDDRFYTIIDKMMDTFTEDDGKMFFNNNTYVNEFRNNRAMFLTCEVKATSSLRDMESTYGMLPIPKYDDKQEEYMTLCSASIMSLCIPSTQTDTTRAGVILDALTYESYESVLPLVFDVRIAQKGLRNEDSIEMFEIIRTTRGTEFARNMGVTVDYLNSLTTMVRGGTNTAASLGASFKSSIEKKLDELLNAFNSSPT